MNRNDFMNASSLVIDVSGTTLKVGDYVILLDAPEELLRNLYPEDKAAICTQVGKSLEVQGFDDYGHAELEFIDFSGIIHFIWVKGSVLRKKDRADSS